MLNANVVHTKQSQRPQCFRNVPKNILPCCKTRWSNRVRSKLTISTRVCVLFPTGVEKLLWFHSGLSSKLQWNVFRKPFYLILFLLEKNIRPQPTRCEKGTNNRNFYTDIYPIFPQVLSYYVRVFDVCGALQYFNMLSPPPPLLLRCLMSGVSRHCCDSRNSPRIQCALMSQREGWSWSHSLSSQVTALSPGTRHLTRLRLRALSLVSDKLSSQLSDFSFLMQFK